MTRNRDDFLDHLFTVYRDLLGDYDASPSFLAEVWARIEARRQERELGSWIGYLTRWAPRLAFSTVALVLLVSASYWIQDSQQGEAALLDASYVDVLMLDSLDEQAGEAWMVARNGK